MVEKKKSKIQNIQKTWTLPIQCDEDGELIIEFPDELMEIVDWQVGDALKWDKLDGGTWQLTKVKV